MDDVDIGIFHLVDPPEGQAEVVADAVAHIDYPWQRIIPAIREDPDQAVIVRWPEKMKQGTTGLFYGNRYEIHLSRIQYATKDNRAAFVFAHEVGHLVDRSTFGDAEKQALIDLYHDSEETYRRDEQYLNDVIIEWAHVHEHTEKWVHSQPHYYFKHNEAYADSFVQAFAPGIWDGSDVDSGQHHIRFTHSTSDLEAVRRITLEKDIQVFEDVGEDHPHREGIEWAAGQGLVKGYDDGTFRPSEPVTRAQLSTILYRQAE